jgi:hypothetical protein
MRHHQTLCIFSNSHDWVYYYNSCNRHPATKPTIEDAQSLCITRKRKTKINAPCPFCVVPSKRLAKTIQSQNKNKNNNTAQEARNQEEIQPQEERT